MTARGWFGGRATQVVKTFASSAMGACSKRSLRCVDGVLDVDTPAVAVSRMLPGQRSQPLAQPAVVGALPTLIALRRAVLADRAAGSPLTSG
jgi:hypothetical protein